MTPGEVDEAVVAAVQAVFPEVTVPDGAWVTWEDTYVTPVAAKLRIDPEPVARELRGLAAVERVEVRGPGLLAISLAHPGMIAGAIAGDPGYGLGPVVPGETWPDRPRTFENPGFRVRFAYERACSVQRRAVDLGTPAGDPRDLDDMKILGLLAALPGRVGARPLRLRLERIADAFHDHCEQGEPPEWDGARVILAGAVRITLNNGLQRLGETARERL